MVLDVVFPPICVACRKYLRADEKESPLCADCEAKIQINNGFYCPVCKRRLATPLKTCHLEIKFILAAATDYENPVTRELIQTLKYKNIRNSIKPIAKIITSYLDKLDFVRSCSKDVLIVPVPLHKKRERLRGFNQSQLIAEIIKEYLITKDPQTSVKQENYNLIRKKPTKTQAEIKNFDDRAENVINCFETKNKEIFAGKNIILVDDVFTSGATMNEAARILKNAGSKKIIGFVVAKA